MAKHLEQKQQIQKAFRQLFEYFMILCTFSFKPIIS